MKGAPFFIPLILLACFIQGGIDKQKHLSERALSPAIKKAKHRFIKITAENEKRFHSIIDHLQELFEPLALEKGAESFEIVRYEWPFNSLNVRMRRGHYGEDGPKWLVVPTGGIYRHELMTEDAFVIMTCHEIGHHIGGHPKKRDLNGDRFWSVTEGQADYFATAKCFRQYAEVSGGNLDFLKRKDLAVPRELRKKCEEIFSNKKDQAICLRSLQASFELVRFIHYYHGEKLDIHKLSYRSKKRVSKTDNHHPSPTCRLETFIEGALCNKSPWQGIGEKDPSLGACSRSEGYKVGTRPRCWYKVKGER